MKKTLVILLLILMVGCSKKYTKTPDDTLLHEDTKTEEMAGQEGLAEEFVEETIVERGADKTGESVISPEEEAKSIFKDVMFDFDKYSIRPDARPILDNVAAFLYKNRKFNVVIEGHCDDRGTNEYNLALGEKRAKSAQGYLSSLGVASSRMMIMTYGEEKPFCIEQDEACWQSNRRVHFLLVQ
jgi:peptidoglycan-associated lipoprotein